jgi:hypothetical protein
MRSFVLMFVVACGQPAQPAAPAQPPPAPAPDAAPPDAPAPVVVAPKPTTCAGGRDDSPPGGSATSICIGDIATDGPINLRGFRESIVNNIGALKACYDGAIPTMPALVGGTVTASLLLLRVGTASNVSAEGFVPEVADCVVRVLAHTAFPYLDAQVHVTFPITFAPPAPGSRP